MVRWYVIFIAIVLGIFGCVLGFFHPICCRDLIAVLTLSCGCICYSADYIAGTIVGEECAGAFRKIFEFLKAVRDFFGGT
jgi:hypothetical protein